jgi:hypothetical protein
MFSTPTLHSSPPDPAADRGGARASHAPERVSADEPRDQRVEHDVTRVFDAIAALLARCPGGTDATLRPLMRTVVAEAKSAGLYAEMLIRLLKESWRALPEPATSEARLLHFEALNRVVVLCIREFYRSDATH